MKGFHRVLIVWSLLGGGMLAVGFGAALEPVNLWLSGIGMILGAIGGGFMGYWMGQLRDMEQNFNLYINTSESVDQIKDDFELMKYGGARREEKSND